MVVSLAKEYRDSTRELWQKYGLFSLKGHTARLGGGKKDVAMLMLYAAMDSYLKDGGKLGFVITQTVFKTKGAGDGFRRFRLGDGQELKVLKVNDLVELQPFEGASNRTSTVVLEKGKATDYPVTYTLWQKTKPGRIAVDSVLEEVEERTCRIDLAARPVNISECTSPWVTTRPKALSALEKVIGKSDYQAHAGACTWLNGVYWLRILERRPEGLLVVENLHDVGKKKVKQVQMVIEPDLVYPLLRGRDVGRWQAKPSACILMIQDPQNRAGYDESWLKVQYPLIYAYLKEFEDMLRERSGYKKYFDSKKDPFYSMYDVAEYTFAPYKVVWPWIAIGLTACVVADWEGKMTIPEHNTSFASFDDIVEAHYVCALLNAAPCDFTIRAYAAGGGGGLASPKSLQIVHIPQFSNTDTQSRLASLSQRAHQLGAQGKEGEEDLRRVEEEIDHKAAELWGLTDEELENVQASLKEIS